MNINFILKLPSKNDGIQPELWRDDKGRLKIVAPFGCDLFDLLKWVDQNPLTQFREINAPASFEPSEQFKHLFSPEGTVL